MKIKVSTATNLQIDWMVAKCEGELNRRTFYVHESTGAFMVEEGEISWVYSPSTNWSKGGLIIERENISVMWSLDDVWHAGTGFSPLGHSLGTTPLIAAMRCYLASKLGDEVEIPEELK